MPEDSTTGESDVDEPVEGDGSLNRLLDELEELESTVDSSEEREHVRDAMRVAMDIETGKGGVFGRVMSGYDRSDAAESLLGALLLGIPMLVEGGTQEVGEFLVDRPLFLAGTLVFAVCLVAGILYIADIQDVRIHEPLFGVIPRKLVGVLTVAALTAVVTMTAWGRVDWSEPWLAAVTVCVAFVPMAMGSALGDLVVG